jgi:hypothetical protein
LTSELRRSKRETSVHQGTVRQGLEASCPCSRSKLVWFWPPLGMGRCQPLPKKRKPIGAYGTRCLNMQTQKVVSIFCSFVVIAFGLLTSCSIACAATCTWQGNTSKSYRDRPAAPHGSDHCKRFAATRQFRPILNKRQTSPGLFSSRRCQLCPEASLAPTAKPKVKRIIRSSFDAQDIGVRTVLGLLLQSVSIRLQILANPTIISSFTALVLRV